MKAMAEAGCHVNLFNFHPKIDRKMTYVLNCSEVGFRVGTHPREIFKRLLPNPKHQEIMEEIYRLGDDRELTYPLPTVVVELPDGGDKGWGGRGRVVLIGDAAHAMRPASGLGGSMAFEDAIVLSRTLKDTDVSCLGSRVSTEKIVQKFESSRYERVKIIWDDQWERSEAAYKKTHAGDKQSAMSGDFAKWVKNGV
jgi:2-polyprenyl-6-methoxyphenol hydroxylase-like FAD-dependent oxidoreductase